MALGNNPTPNELVKEVRNIGSNYVPKTITEGTITTGINNNGDDGLVAGTTNIDVSNTYSLMLKADNEDKAIRLESETASDLSVVGVSADGMAVLGVQDLSGLGSYALISADLTNGVAVAGTAFTYNEENVLVESSLKTINNQSLVGSGNITISGGSSGIVTINITAETVTFDGATIINLPISNADWALLTEGTFAQFKVDLSSVYSSLSSVDITYITNSLNISDFDGYMILNTKSNLSSSTIGGMYLTSDFKNFGAAAEWNFCGSISVTESDGHDYKTLLITSQNIENFVNANDVPVESGTGKDTVKNKTPYDETDVDGQGNVIDRTNTVAGNFSAAFGSRNNIGAGSSETFVTGGKNTITHTEDALVSGYENTVSSSHQSIIGGYDNNVKASESVVVGEGNTLDGTITGVSYKTDTRSMAVFGNSNSVGINNKHSLIAGEDNEMGINGKWNFEVGAHHDVGRNNECVNVLGWTNTTNGYLTDSTLAGYENTAYGGASGNNTFSVYMLGHSNDNQDPSNPNKGLSEVYQIGHGLLAKHRGQVILGKYNRGNVSEINDILTVGCGTSNSSRSNCFGTGNNGTDNYIRIGSTQLTEPKLSDLEDNAVTNFEVDGNTFSSNNSVELKTINSDYDGLHNKLATGNDLANKMDKTLTGTSAPTTSTAGQLGQLYINTTNNKTYQCYATTTENNTTTYTWEEIGGGGSSGIPIVNSTATRISVGEDAYLINIPVSNNDWALLVDGTYAQFNVDLSNIYSSIIDTDIVYITHNLDLENLDVTGIISAFSNLDAASKAGMFLASGFKNFGPGASWQFVGTITTTESDGDIYKSLYITSQVIPSDGGTLTDVQVDSTSIVSGGVADLLTINANYNASTNKLATASDISNFTEKTITENDVTTGIQNNGDGGLIAGSTVSGVNAQGLALKAIPEDESIRLEGASSSATSIIGASSQGMAAMYVEASNEVVSSVIIDSSGDVAITGSTLTFNGTDVATTSDLPASITITTTSGSESISDGTNTLSFGSNAFSNTTIPSTTDNVTNGSTSALTSGGAYTALSSKQNSTDNNLDTTSKTVVGAINEVNSVAKQANIAKSYANYSAFITALNSATATAYNVGQSFYIETLEVPDLWVISVESSSSTYTYTTDAAFVAATGASGGQQVGYYKIGQLETQKVDISTKMNTSNPTGTGSFSLNRKANTTVGDYSTTLNYDNTSSGYSSFTNGQGNTASGGASHAEGFITTASGSNSHAEGYGTIAQGNNQHASGKFNIADNSKAEIVGNGTADNARSNARTLDWDGNECLAGRFQAAGGFTDGNNANYELHLPDTTSWTADKTVATTDQIPTNYVDTSSSQSIGGTKNFTGALQIGGTGVSDFIVEQGTDYIRLGSGIQICWGRKLSNTTGAYSITFPKAFKSGTYPTVTSTFEGASGTANYYSYVIKDSLSNTGCQMKGYNGNYMGYSAFGVWK